MTFRLNWGTAAVSLHNVMRIFTLSALQNTSQLLAERITAQLPSL